ncbi:MAG: TonB-dependent receptor [Thermoanaerobaculia bacterium]|nr:TonB-dependent receptor [Thermoanaerobaculia bacterium]
MKSTVESAVRSFAVAGLAMAVAAMPAARAAQLGEAEGEPADTYGETIVVSATRSEVPKALVGSSVTVIDRAEIEARDEISISTLLRTVAGLEVVQAGGPGAATSVFLRGANSNATLILVDGVRVNGPTGGGFDLADLTTDNVERIEVLRGSQSALYGSEAIGGVISIFTRRGVAGLDGDLVAEGGSDDYGRLRAGVRGSSSPRFDYSATVSHQQNDGFSKASESAGNREKDDWKNTTASAALGGDFADDGRFDVTLRGFDAETGLDGFAFPIGPVDDPDYRQQRRGVVGAAEVAKDLGSGWRQSFRVGVADDELEGIDPTTDFNNFLIDSRVIEVDLKSDLELAKTDVLTVGYTFQDQEGSSRGAFDESTDLSSFYLQNRWQPGDDLSVTVGARSDDHSTFGSEVTYRGAVAWIFSADTRVHASVGTGFKAPSYFDLFLPGFGNPDLEAETSTTWDVGIGRTWRQGRTTVDLTWFDGDFDDLISFNAAFMAVNVAEAAAHGVEATFGWMFDDRYRWDASYTWTDSEDRATGLPLARRPEHRFATSLLFEPTSRWRGAVTLVAVRDRIDADGSDMDDYERVDANASYRVLEGLRVGARVLNLLDQDYEEINGFTTPGLQVALTVGYSR